MKKFKIEAKGKNAEIWIYDDIGDTWIGGISAKQFADELKDAGKVDTINVYINSSGGSIMDGLAIYNTLKRHKARKIVEIDGFAVSIASLVAMSGDEIRMAENGMIMIHNPWIVTSGTADELREQADAMDKIKGGMVGTYQKKSGQDEGLIAEMMDAETWMTADEALEMGFIDEITAEQKIAACFDFKKFKNAPDRLRQPETTKPPGKPDTPKNFSGIDEWKKRILVR